MSLSINSTLTIIVYVDEKKGGEFFPYCRFTYGLPISPKNNEVVLATLSLNTEDGIDMLIRTADYEFRNYPLIKYVLEALRSTGESVITTMTAHVLLNDLFGCALSINFPSFAPIVPFAFKWFPKNEDNKRYPVKVMVDF